MKHHLKALGLAGALLLVQATGDARQQPDSASAPVVLSEPVLTRLPSDWRAPVSRHVRATPGEQQRFLTVSAEVLRQTLARLLARVPAADSFLKAQLAKDASPLVRTTILQTIAADPRWMSMPDTPALIEGVVTSDAEPKVSMAALEALRRWRMRSLNALLNRRVGAAIASKDDTALPRLLDEQERWLSLERGTMLPAFLRSPVPMFTASPTDRPIRVVAFGDFGTGSDAQQDLGRTLVAYHQARPFDLGITLGDNFYSVGMESPSDSRWQTQWEQIYAPLGIPFYAALGNHDWGHPDSPAAEILYSARNDNLADAELLLHLLGWPRAVLRARYTKHRAFRESAALAGYGARSQPGTMEDRLRAPSNFLGRRVRGSARSHRQAAAAADQSRRHLYLWARSQPSGAATGGQRALLRCGRGRRQPLRSPACTNAPSSRAARTALPSSTPTRPS